MALSQDGATLATLTELQDKLRVYSVATGGLFREFAISNGMVSATEQAVGMAFEYAGRRVRLTLNDDSTRVFDLAQGEIRAAEAAPSREAGDYQLSARPDGLTYLKDSSGALLAVLAAFPGNKWAVIDPVGLYDGSNPDGLEEIHWLIDGRVVNIGQLNNHRLKGGGVGWRLKVAGRG